MKSKTKRRVLPYIFLIVITIFCGIFSRSQLFPLPCFIVTYAGDTIWALMVFLCLCIIARHEKTWKIALVAILFSYAVEFSQFYHAPWIDSMRNTTLGGLALGFGFKFSDLICYTVGVFLGACIDKFLIRLNKKD